MGLAWDCAGSAARNIHEIWKLRVAYTLRIAQFRQKRPMDCNSRARCNDGAVVTVMRTVETRVSHTSDAARVSDVRSFELGVSGSCAEVRAAVAQAGALIGGGCECCSVCLADG